MNNGDTQNLTNAQVPRAMSESYAGFTRCVSVIRTTVVAQDGLIGMTVDPAYASFTEDTLGSITPGKRPDFVILSQDIMTVSTDQILKTRVQATFIDGKIMYGDL